MFQFQQHEYDPEQIDRYFAMAQQNFDTVAARDPDSDPVHKDALSAAIQAWRLAAWALLASQRRVEFGDLQKSITQDEMLRAVAGLMHMPEFDRVMETAEELLRCTLEERGWREYANGETIDRPTFNAYMGSLRAAFSRARQMIDAGPA